MSKPHAIIIGGGYTGLATAHDLCLRGFAVTVVDRGELISGASGRTMGVLHSGGRYAGNDRESAAECIEENLILKKITPECIEPCGGLYLAQEEEDLDYKKQWIEGCELCHIPYEELTVKQALGLVPNLNPRVHCALMVPDGAFDPLRLGFAFAATAKSNGAKIMPYHDVTELILEQGKVVGIRGKDLTNLQPFEIRGDIVVNATGVWVNKIIQQIGLPITMTICPGMLVVVNARISNMHLHHLHKPSDGDSLICQRRMFILGTTAYVVDDPDYLPIIKDHIRLLVQRAAKSIPIAEHTPIRAVFVAARPLLGEGTGRTLTRTFKSVDHKEIDGVDGIVSIVGGKATTCRAMAETVSDVVCKKLGMVAKCETKDRRLLSYRKYYELPG
jgi:glycerol-3-phosphate dehydrogenase